MSLLEVRHLKKVYTTRFGGNQVEALRNVNFTVEAGEYVAIMGESGSGKTTAVNMIARLVDVTSGSVFLDGEDITHLKGKALREVYKTMQMVFQTPADSFDPRRTLGDGIGESLRNAGLSRKETREKVEALLKDCGLPPEYADRYPHQVSGGQCQRAAIARALAIEPRLLICDEITSALDVTVQKEILELLNALRTQRGRDLSILFICHDISLVQQFCDRVLVMYHGKIVEEGTPDEVIRNPQNDYTKRLIDSVLS